jgi:hypothetical protein
VIPSDEEYAKQTATGNHRFFTAVIIINYFSFAVFSPKIRKTAGGKENESINKR